VQFGPVPENHNCLRRTPYREIVYSTKPKRLSIVPGAGGSYPGTDLSVNICILPIPNYDFAIKPHPGSDESELSVAMGRLVKIHEIHVDACPWQFLILFNNRSPEIHIHAGENVCIHVISPTQLFELFASRHS
jgi:hypothetical protein